MLLRIATGMLDYPLFLTPLWFGYLRRRDGIRNGLAFLVGFAAVGLTYAVMLMVMVEPVDQAQSP